MGGATEETPFHFVSTDVLLPSMPLSRTEGLLQAVTNASPIQSASRLNMFALSILSVLMSTNPTRGRSSLPLVQRLRLERLKATLFPFNPLKQSGCHTCNINKHFLSTVYLHLFLKTPTGSVYNIDRLSSVTESLSVTVGCNITHALKTE